MQEYQAGRFEAVDQIHVSIAPALRRYLLSHVRDAAKADDLVQETFLQIHRARHIAGAVLGLGAGLMADAGWRLFCHFSEPGHVLPAHLGGVVLAMVAGILLSIRLKADTTR